MSKASLFRELSSTGVLVLPNAWDAGSAAVIARAGAAAIATTSGGVAWSLGRTDAQGLTRTEMADAIRRIVAAVNIPVTADMEGGYGPTPDDVALTVRAAIDAGAAGMNLEDSNAADGTLFTPRQQAERLQAGREAAAAAGEPDFFINARTDVFLFQVGDPAARLDDVLARGESYAKAGADGLFVPGLTDLATLTTLTATTPLPVNAMSGPGGPTIADLTTTGVRRISIGTAIAEAAYAVADRAARELLTAGTYGALEPHLAYPEINSLF